MNDTTTVAIDHKKEAESLTGADWRSGVAVPQHLEALTHATLYLAEQQRIANMIAWTSRDGYRPTDEVADQIVNGLGL